MKKYKMKKKKLTKCLRLDQKYSKQCYHFNVRVTYTVRGMDIKYLVLLYFPIWPLPYTNSFF